MNEARASTREDLPNNIAADEYRKVVREVTMEYLRDKSSRDERKEVIKEAFKELAREYAAKFGWFSARTLAVMFVMAMLYIWLTSNGWHK